MADTITIDLNAKSAIDGFAALGKEIDKTDQSVNELEQAGESLSVIQQQQITLIQQQTTDWKTFTSQMTQATIPALSEVTVEALHVGLELERMAHAGVEFAVKGGLKVIDTLGDMAKMTLKYTLLTKGAVDVIGAIRGKTDEATKSNEKNADSMAATAIKTSTAGFAIKTVTGDWDSFGQAAAGAAGAVTRYFVPGLIIADVALTGFDLAMANTGKRIDAVTGQMTTNLDRIGTAQNRLAENLSGFVPTLDDLKAGFAGLVPEMRFAREGWEKFDKSMTASADGIRNATADLAVWVDKNAEARRESKRLDEQMAASLSTFAALGRANDAVANSFKDRYESERRKNVGKVADSSDDAAKQKNLRSIDDQIEAKSKEAQSIEINLRKQRDAYDGSARAEKAYAEAVIKSRTAMNENQQSAEELIKKRRELNALPPGAKIEEWFAKQTDFEKQALSDIARETQLIKERATASASAAAQRTAESLKGITDEKELAAAKEKAAQEGVALANETASQLNSLAARREQIETDSLRRQFGAQQKFNEDRKKQQEEYQKERWKRYEEDFERTKQQYARERQLEDQASQFKRDAISDSRRDFLEGVEDRIKASGKESETQGALYALKQLRIKEERASALAEIEARKVELLRGAENEKQRINIAHDAELRSRAVVEKATRDMTQAETQFNRQQMSQKLRDRQDADAKAVKSEEEKQAKIKAAMDGIIQGAKGGDGAGAFDPAAILKGQSTKDVRANLIDKAKKEAAEKFKKDNQGSLDATPNYDQIRGTLIEKFDPTRVALAMKDDERVQAENRRKFDVGQRRAQEQAAREAAKDFAKGETDPAQLAQAQADAANKTAQALVAQGKLGDDVAKVLQNQIQIAAQQQAKSEILDRQIQQLKDAQEVLIGAGNANQNRPGFGGGRN